MPVVGEATKFPTDISTDVYIHINNMEITSVEQPVVLSCNKFAAYLPQLNKNGVLTFYQVFL